MMYAPDANYCWCRLPCGICSRTGQPCPKNGATGYPFTPGITSTPGVSWTTFGANSESSVNTVKGCVLDGGKTEDKS